MLKECGVCKIEKPTSQFYGHQRNKTPGKADFFWACKTCYREKTEAWRKANLARHNEATKRWKEKSNA